MKIRYFILFIIFFGIIIFVAPTAVWGSIDCCYHECRLTEPARCDGAWAQKCGQCDIDLYYDWCSQVNCAASGKICQNGVCLGSGCAVNCPTGPGCLNSLTNGRITGGECCGSGSCYECRAGFTWDSANRICKISSVPSCSDGTLYNQCSTSQGKPWFCNNSGSLIENSGSCGCRNNWTPGPTGTYCCDNQCNAVCSKSGCTAAQDPDCGSTGCCGDKICNNSETNSICPGDCAITTCATFTYSAWSACQNGSQIRTVLTSSPAGCTGGTRVTTQTCDSIKPVVNSFSVFSTAVVSWDVSSGVGGALLARVEVWRAPDVSGSPGVWAEVVSLRKNLADNSANRGSVKDNPPIGAWWYGIHVVDKAGNWGTEAAPKKIAFTASLTAIPTNSNAICIYNSNDAVSAEICDYYAQKRPGSSKLGLNVPNGIFINIQGTTWQYKEWSTLADFLNYIKKPLDSYIAAHPELRITHVAVARGLPIRVTMQVIPPITRNNPLTGNQVQTESYMSNTVALEKELDYSLCGAVIDEACSKKLYNKDSRSMSFPGFDDESGTYQPARNAHLLEHFNAAEYQYFSLGIRPKYVSSNLNGYNLEDIKRMIDRAQATAPDLSKVKWVADGDTGNSYWPDEHATVHKFLITAGISSDNIILEKTNTAPLDLLGLNEPLVGYYSPGDHHPGYPFNWALTKVKALVANRAVVTSYESFNGYTFSLDPYNRVDKGSDQSIPSDFISSIAFGGTNYSGSFSGGYGNVYEPNLIGADHAEDFFLSYASGMTLAEAFFNTWESPHNIAWGDPLMRITDSTDNRKPNGMACVNDAECRSGSKCLADDLGFKFCFTPESGSCLFSRPRSLNPGLRMYNILAPNGSIVCEDAPDGKSSATILCVNSRWQRTACAPDSQCGYSSAPNVWYNYLVDSYAGANCKAKAECSVDADCSFSYCDADMNGVNRCHITESSCVSGLEVPTGLGASVKMSEVPSGAYGCAIDQRRRAQCNNAVWSNQTQCRNGCIFGSCTEEFYNTALQTFNLLPQRSYQLTFPVNIGSKTISEVFANPPSGTKIRMWDKQTQQFGVEKIYLNGWSGGDAIIRSDDVFRISVPANYSFKISGTEFNTVLPFSIKIGAGRTLSSFGMPYCAEKYTAAKLLREISAVDNRCVAIITYSNGIDPTVYWSDAENHGINGIKQNFKILPFEGYLIKCAEGVDFIFTPSCQ